MDSFIERVFISEIKTQCEFALRAVEELRQELELRDTRRVFFYAQAFLGAAGNVSKLLWPQSPKIPGRGERLRELLRVPDDSPVEPRTFRNHFEHFDERLEDWAMASRNKVFVDFNVAPAGGIVGPDPADFMRNLDPNTLTLTFRGETYELGSVERALRDIQKVAEAKLNERWH
jgi:hypothetical protein